MDKELKFFNKTNVLGVNYWYCELWSEFEEPFHAGKQFVESIQSETPNGLFYLVEQKGWLELLKNN